MSLEKTVEPAYLGFELEAQKNRSPEIENPCQTARLIARLMDNADARLIPLKGARGGKKVLRTGSNIPLRQRR